MRIEKRLCFSLRLSYRQKALRKLIILLLLSLGGHAYPAFSASTRSHATVLASGESGMRLRLLPGVYPQRTINLHGRSYLKFDGAVAPSGEPGKPLLPSEGILIGIPMNVSVSVEVVEASYDVLPQHLIAPAPKIELDEDRNGHEEYVVDEAAYSRNVWYPENVVGAAEISQLRLQRVAKILLHPYQFNPATNTLKKLNSLTLKLKFSSPKQTEKIEAVRPAGFDPHFEDVYKNLLVNYEEAKKWRGVPSRSVTGGLMTDPSRDWFDPAKPYVKLSIVKDGIYKLRPNDLTAAGVNFTGVDPRTLKIFNKGGELPLFVAGEADGVLDDSDYIEFFAQRNYGAGEFYDTYTDTNAYWLTWGGANGLRMNVEATDTTGSASSYFVQLSHYEQDEQFYFGYSAEEIIQPGPVPGKGWYWKDFSVGSPPIDFQFQVDAPKAGTGTPSRLKIRFHGMTATSPPSQHSASIALNGVNLGTTSWSQNTESIFEVTFSDTVLHSGTNTLRVTPTSPGGSNVSRFYLDWYEVTFASAFQASSNELRFLSLPGSGAGPTRYTVAGFQSNAVDVYNLSDRKKIVGGRVATLPNGTFSIAFHDTGVGSKEYVVLAESQKRKPARLEVKQFKDIRVNSSGGDYIIITHGLFKPAAERLAAYRASQLNVRSSVVDVQDIYDEFNYGVFNAEAIKAFLRYAYDQWPGPRPSYVLLFGDASWDYKAHLPSTVKKNFIPGYGNPPSDNWFVAFDSTDNLLPYMMTGRIPAENTFEAEGFVDKLIRYDHTPPKEWTKSFLFITGGNDDFEKFIFNSQAENLISSYVTPAPVAGVPTRVYKTTDAIIDGENKQLIQNIISNGVVFLNFIGHSGGRIWGVDAGNPNDLRNTNGQFVFLTSVSCNVGAFADPRSNVLTEDFLFADQRAAIGGWAGSSLGYVDIGSYLSNSFLRMAARDTLRGMGKLTTLSRIELWMLDHTSPRFVAAVQLHPFLGDPIASLALPVKPDLAISSSDISFDPNVPTEIDSVTTINARIWNYGLIPKDSISVSFTDVFGGSEMPIGVPIQRLAPVGFKDSLTAKWEVSGKSGNHLIKVQVDPANQVEEVTKGNNRADVSIQVFPTRLLTIRPAASSLVPSGPQTLEVTSPVVSMPGLKYFFEVDTTAQFNSSAKIVSPSVDAGILTTRWETPALIREGVYFWRSRTYDGRDSAAWVSNSFVVSQSQVPPGVIRWSEKSSEQFRRDQRFQADVADSGVTISRSDGIPLYVRSVGDRHDPYREFYSVLRVGIQTITVFNFSYGAAFVVATVNEVNGGFQYRPFTVGSDPSMADSMAAYLRSIPSGEFILITVVIDGYTNDNENLYTALESLGATQIRSVRPGDAWAFIAQKRTNFSLESLSTDSAAELNYTIPSFYDLQTGTIATSPIGPARRWRSVSWDYNATGATNITLRVLDAQSNSILDSLSSSLTSKDISSIDARVHSSLKLLAFLRSEDGKTTPILKSWELEYEGLPDPAVGPAVFRASRDSVLEGETITFSVDVYNIGYTNADSVQVKFYTLEQNNGRTLFQSSRIDNIEPEKFKTAQATFNTTGRRGSQSLLVELDPGAMPELYSVNNSATRGFYVIRDTVPPQLEVTFDGVRILDGDFVSPRPGVLIKLFDNSPLAIHDTSNVTLRLDNRRVPYGGNPQVSYNFPQSGSEKASIEYRPVLNDGAHTLQIDALDASGNAAGRSAFRVDFNVQSAPNLLNIYNYPNPFARETYFTFTFAGGTIPDELIIKVYTVAGRLVRTIHVAGGSLRFGFNRIFWDGRDEDGNELANGVYLYTMLLRSAEKTEHVSSPQRMAKVR